MLVIEFLFKLERGIMEFHSSEAKLSEINVSKLINARISNRT